MADNDKIIEQQLNQLLNGMGDIGEHTSQLKEQVENLRTEYRDQREAAKTGTPKEKSAFESFQTALAGSLPGMTKGTLSAITAFQQQPPDNIAGSAAIMDICSSLASGLGGLSTAGGAPGAVLGALFSMVSMILNFFAPKPPSLLSQIETLMRDLDAEKKKSEIEAAGDAVFVYANGCDAFMKPTPDGGVQDPKFLYDELKLFNLVEGNTVTTIRTVRKWLLTDGNQELDGWPEVLNLQCSVYMHLTLAVTRQNLYAHDKEKIKKYVGEEPDPLKVKAWGKLQAKVKEHLENVKQNNQLALEFLNEIVPIARKRGVFVAAYPGGMIYAVTGPKAFRENKFVNGIFNHCRRMAITPPKEGVNTPAARYHLWVLDSGIGGFAYHNTLNSRTRTLTQPYADHVGPADSTVGNLFLDWWPLPDAGNTFAVRGTRNWRVGGAMEHYVWNQDGNTVERINWAPGNGSRLFVLRVATPAKPLSDDPDKGEMPDWKGSRIFYASVEDSKNIFLWYDGHGKFEIPIPMASYSGIAVDPYFLWVYGRDGFACATHASVISCVNKQREMPLWLGPPKNNLGPVLDLSSCEDSTLLVSTPDQLSTAVYHVDFKTPNVGGGERLTVEEWETLAGQAGPSQVQKLPIFGWSLIERSLAVLGNELSGLV